jgi:hypothetical protein
MLASTRFLRLPSKTFIFRREQVIRSTILQLLLDGLFSRPFAGTKYGPFKPAIPDGYSGVPVQSSNLTDAEPGDRKASSMEVAKLSDLLGPARGGTRFNHTSLVSVPTSTVKARSSARKARSRCGIGAQPRRELGYCSPAEFEQKSDGVEAARSATVRFFARNEEESTGLPGERTQTPSLPPDPTLLGESTT